MLTFCVELSQTPQQFFPLFSIRYRKLKTVLFSCFSLKLESWLAVNKIPYENVYTMEFSEKGQIPYVEFNGSQIADR